MRIQSGKETYIIEKMDDYNYRLIKEYVSKAKGHEGKTVHGEPKYYPTLRKLLSSLSKKKIEEAIILGNSIDKAMEELEYIIDKATGGRS